MFNPSRMVVIHFTVCAVYDIVLSWYSFCCWPTLVHVIIMFCVFVLSDIHIIFLLYTPPNVYQEGVIF